MAVITGVRSRRRCCGACHGTQTSSNRRTDPGSMPTTGDRADYGPGAGSDQAAADRSLGGIVGVRVGRRRQQQSSAYHAGNSRSLSHSFAPGRIAGQSTALSCGGLAHFTLEGQTNGKGCGSTPACVGHRVSGSRLGLVRFLSNSHTGQGAGLDTQSWWRGGLALFGQTGSALFAPPCEFPQQAPCSAPDRGAADPCFHPASFRFDRSRLLNR